MRIKCHPVFSEGIQPYSSHSAHQVVLLRFRRGQHSVQVQPMWVLVLSAPGHHYWSHTYFLEMICIGILVFFFLFIRTRWDAGCEVLSGPSTEMAWSFSVILSEQHHVSVLLMTVSWQKHILWAFCACVFSFLCGRAMIPCPHFHGPLPALFLKPLTSLPACNLFPFLLPKVGANSVNTLVPRISYMDTCILAFLRQFVYFFPCPKLDRPFLKSFSVYCSESPTKPGIAYSARLASERA